MGRKGIPGGPVIGSECFKNKVMTFRLTGPEVEGPVVKDNKGTLTAI